MYVTQCVLYAVIYSHGVVFALGCVHTFSHALCITYTGAAKLHLKSAMVVLYEQKADCSDVCPCETSYPNCLLAKTMSKRFNNTLQIVPNLMTAVLQLLKPTYVA